MREVEWLKKELHIQAILTLNETPLKSSWILGISYKHKPLKNHQPPSVPELMECTDFILKQVLLGKRILVHCSAGRGRTGTVLAAYLCRKYAFTAKEAIDEVRRRRPTSVENIAQENSVHVFYRISISKMQTGDR